jgi:gluconolactonase
MHLSPEISIDQFEIYCGNLDHPESLAFDAEGNLWAGGEAGQVYCIDASGKAREICNLGGFCAGLAFSPDDILFVCNSELGIVRVNPSGVFEVFANRASSHRITFANFQVFDSHGNLYVSDSGEWGRKNGHLLRFNPQGEGGVVGGPYGYANGLALSADERFLFMVESDTNCIYRFEILNNGELGKKELYAKDVGRVPDGLALDATGNLLVCCYASDDIYLISPQLEKSQLAFDPNGMLLCRPTNMAFGERSFDKLYIANLGGRVISRVSIGREGQKLANLR